MSDQLGEGDVWLIEQKPKQTIEAIKIDVLKI